MTEVLVGDKDSGRYITAVNKQLEGNETVKVLSRGKENNGKTLDVAEIVGREEGVDVESISTDTAVFENNDGEEIQVTELEVVIKKKVEE